jgi:glycosyltransferase involved in cell wall biosynthesis
VSTVDLYKHQWHVVEACAHLRARGMPMTLDLVGSAYPPAFARLDAAVERLDPGRRFVRYAGAVDHDALPARYHAADAFVFASSCENMPNVLLEAMAAGLPIACAERGPMPSVLGDAGVYFDPESPGTIAAALERLAADPALRSDLARRAHERALAYSWARTAADTFAFLADIAAACSEPPRSTKISA